METSSEDVVIKLPRGGTIVRSSAGLIQVGAPPETIKDCMVLKIQNPAVYVIPKELFDRDHGINLAEVEFPAYFNFFILNKRVTFVCSAEVEQRLRIVFRETLLGPEKIDLSSEFPREAAEYAPDLINECASLRTFHAIEELFEFVHFDGEGVAAVGDVQIQNTGTHFIFHDAGKEVARVPTSITLPESMYKKAPLNNVLFEAPSFGVTTLGSAHGFDPSHNTCGVVVWMHGRGIMVDPPLNSSNALKSFGIPSHLIDSVILTHCHADHDAGLFQKILEERHVTIYTSQTIMQSFVRKYAAILDIDGPELMSLFNFRSVPFDGPLRIFGGEIFFHYSIHTIPCIGFSAYFGGKSLYYSGDTRHELEFIRSLSEKGVMPQKRADFFLNYGWHQTAILHEAGVPPIHTPMSVLTELPQEIKDRLYLIHTSTSSIPEGSGLRVAEEGVENTIILDPISPPSYGDAIEVLSIIEQVDLFRNFSLIQAKEVLQVLKRDTWSVGQSIIAEGSVGNSFFVIVSGIVSVIQKGNLIKNLSHGDYFGEMALITDCLRSASCVAHTEVKTITFERVDFLRILRGETSVVDRIFQLARMRLTPSWATICANNFLNRLSNSQKRQVESVIHIHEASAGEFIWRKGDPLSFAVLVGSGMVRTGDGKEYTTGAFIGCKTSVGSTFSVGDLVATLAFDLEAVTDVVYYRVNRADLNEIYKMNPGMRLSLMHRTAVL